MTETATHAEEYDLVVLGTGEGGKYLAWTLAKARQARRLVERKYIGGSCPNIACLPSKNIIHSAKVASYFYRSAEFGISKDNVRIDMAAGSRAQAQDGRWPGPDCISTISSRAEPN